MRIEGLSPEEVKQQDRGLFSPLWNQALHLAIEVDDFQNLGDEDPLPMVSRDRAFALRALKEQISSGGGEEVMALLTELVGDSSPSRESPGLEEEILLRELNGSHLPFLGDVSMEAKEGLLGWMGGDVRTLRSFRSTLLWGLARQRTRPCLSTISMTPKGLIFSPLFGNTENADVKSMRVISDVPKASDKLAARCDLIPS